MMGNLPDFWAGSRRVSRRGLIRGGLLAGGALTGLSLLSCGTSKRGGPAASSLQAGQAAPRRGGVLRIGLTSDPGGLDFQQVTDVEGLFVLMPLYSQVL